MAHIRKHPTTGKPQVRGIDPATIYTWRYRNKGPQGFRVGRHLRFREGDVEKWLGNQLAESNEETS